jgi:hypothetical protein
MIRIIKYPEKILSGARSKCHHHGDGPDGKFMKSDEDAT